MGIPGVQGPQGKLGQSESAWHGMGASEPSPRSTTLAASATPNALSAEEAGTDSVGGRASLAQASRAPPKSTLRSRRLRFTAIIDNRGRSSRPRRGECLAPSSNTSEARVAGYRNLPNGGGMRRARSAPDGDGLDTFSAETPLRRTTVTVCRGGHLTRRELIGEKTSRGLRYPP